MFVNKLWQFNLPKPTCCSSTVVICGSVNCHLVWESLEG